MSKQFDRNSVAIFSSGIALYKRVVKLRAGEKRLVSLAVNRDHLDNVLRSFTVKGKGVSWSTPATYSTGQQSNLNLDPTAVTESLATNLAGAKIEITRASGEEVSGILQGLDSRTALASGQAVQRQFFTVRTRQGTVSVGFDEVKDYRFPDKAVRDEIKRALDQHIRKIKKDAVNFEVELTADNDVEATVLYTQPAAAWKLSFRLPETAPGSYGLEAYGVVDNNTPEDWDDYALTLVNGDPIHFASNIADVVFPERQFVNAITAKAAGPVTPEAGRNNSQRSGAPQRSMMKTLGAPAPAGLMPMNDAASFADEGPSAFTAQTDALEVGDFDVYPAKELVSIGGGSSGLVPLFSTALDGAGAFLFYDPAKDANRPWRAVRFKAPKNYGRGLCTVYLHSDEGAFFGGECVLEAAKAGEERLAVHQRETGVKITREADDAETRRISIEIAKGFLVSEVQYTQKTTYKARNNTSTSFKLALDHTRQWGNKSTLGVECSACTPDGESLSNGNRYTVSLGPNAEIEVVVTEHLVQTEEVKVESGTAAFTQWLRANVVSVLNPLSQDDKVLKCLAIQTEIDKANQRLADEVAQARVLQNEQNELRQNLTAAGESAPYRSEWQNDLYENQKKIRKSQKETQPVIQAEVKDLQGKLLAALRDLTASWKE